jgi:hypothetical protein
MERARGIEPTSEAWEANNKNLKTLELAALNKFDDATPSIGKQMENETSEGHPA